MPFANIAIQDADGSNELVAAVPGERIIVTSLLLAADGAVDVYMASAADPIALGDSNVGLPLGDKSHVLPPGEWYQTAIGEALNIVGDASVGIVGHLTYKTSSR